MRAELVKTFALAMNIFENDLGENPDMPFRHHSVDDMNLLKAE